MSPPERLAFYLEKLDALVFAAERDGVQLTAETVSLPPLAMGRHYTKTDVRPMHKLHGPPIETWGDHLRKNWPWTVREQVEQMSDMCVCGCPFGAHGVTNSCPNQINEQKFKRPHHDQH